MRLTHHQALPGGVDFKPFLLACVCCSYRGAPGSARGSIPSLKSMLSQVSGSPRLQGLPLQQLLLSTPPPSMSPGRLSHDST